MSNAIPAADRLLTESHRRTDAVLCNNEDFSTIESTIRAGESILRQIRNAPANQRQAALEHYSDLRNALHQALQLSTILPIRRITAHVQFLPFMNMVLECHCHTAFARLEAPLNGRDYIVEKTLASVQALKKLQIPPHIISFGSGRLGQEIYLLDKLRTHMSSQESIRLDAIDHLYQNANSQIKGAISELENQVYGDATQFCKEVVLLVSGLGYNLKLTASSADTSILFNQLQQSFNEIGTHIPQNPTVELRIFGSTEQYVQQIQTQDQNSLKLKPNILFDIDTVNFDEISIDQNGKTQINLQQYQPLIDQMAQNSFCHIMNKNDENTIVYYAYSKQDTDTSHAFACARYPALN